MHLDIFATKTEMGRWAALRAAEVLTQAIAAQGQAHLILATGASQFEMLSTLVTLDVDWSNVTAFHLDEYVGLSPAHPASFGRYLQERFVDHIPSLKAFHFINGLADPALECARLAKLISPCTIDLACIGIGENGHLAFNDPPADFETRVPYHVVNLDAACRGQQVGEGWFPSLQDVPVQAISMTIQHILRSRAIVCTVPDLRKAAAVQAAIEGPLTNQLPASILRTHPHCDCFLDEPAASRLSQHSTL